MRFLQWGLVAGAIVLLALWYAASSVVDNYSIAAIVAGLSVMVALFLGRRVRRP